MDIIDGNAKIKKAVGFPYKENGKMASTVVQEFTKEEMRSVVRFLQAEGVKTSEIYCQMSAVYGDKCMSRSQVYGWMSKFKSGITSVEDKPRIGRPVQRPNGWWEEEFQDKSSEDDSQDRTTKSMVQPQDGRRSSGDDQHSAQQNVNTAESEEEGNNGDTKEEVKQKCENKSENDQKGLWDSKTPCDRCGDLILKSAMAEHLAHLHSAEAYACEECGKSFPTLLACQHHKTVKHSELSPFQCQYCKRTLSNSLGLTKHIARFHGSPDAKIHECKICKKMFVFKEDLKHHLGYHNAKSSFLCATCGKGFRTKAALQDHEHIHTFRQTFKCLHCDRRYKSKRSVKRHMLSHIEDKRFLCNICGKQYRQKRGLTKHMIVHTNDRPYKCDQCSKTYRSPNCLQAHKDTHTGFKRWKCIYCDKRFFNEANMYKHRKRHLHAYRHTCSICGKQFIEKQELTSHSKTHLVST